MTKAYSLYTHNSKHNRDLDALYEYIQGASPDFDASQLLRSEYALIVSSFDKYIHDVVKEIMLQYFFNKNIEPDNPLVFSIYKMQILLDEPNQINRELLLDSYIREATSKLSFQSPQSIEYALSLIGLKKIWSQLDPIMGQSASDIREQLAIFINRRNKIVHEADIDSATNTHVSIDLNTVNLCHVFINNLVEAIEKIIEKTK
jgi:hypothetical protein